jgi:hypothetical protein
MLVAILRYCFKMPNDDILNLPTGDMGRRTVVHIGLPLRRGAPKPKSIHRSEDVTDTKGWRFTAHMKETIADAHEGGIR